MTVSILCLYGQVYYTHSDAKRVMECPFANISLEGEHTHISCDKKLEKGQPLLLFKYLFEGNLVNFQLYFSFNLSMKKTCVSFCLIPCMCMQQREMFGSLVNSNCTRTTSPGRRGVLLATCSPLPPSAGKTIQASARPY